MRVAHPIRLIVAGLAFLAAPLVAHAQDVLAGAPVDVSVTVYRDPHRGEGGFDLDYLQGFALITETRRVVLPPGVHSLRFEGVADGIEPASAIVTGLPNGVIEKNRDAALLSPSALIESAEAQGGRVLMSRTGPGASGTVRTEGRIRSGADGGVVFETADGIEALRCSGLSETFSFEAVTKGLSAKPTLSVMTRATQQVEAVVQLSYLSRGFDWAADYVVDMGASGKMDLGAWVTLANGNGTAFPNARVQIVAGRLNRDTGEIDPIDIGQPILARCWPQGSTSDTPAPITIERAYPLGFEPRDERDYAVAMPSPAAPPRMLEFAKAEDVVVTGSRVQQEELGDLKLYRVPDRSTLSSRQSKQVRLLDREAVPVVKVYEATIHSYDGFEFEPVPVLLRTRNDKKNNLGLPLPSGRVSVFETVSGASAQKLLSGETGLRDIAIDEETEIRLEGGAAVQMRQVDESVEIADSPRSILPFLRGENLRDGARLQEINRVELSNAHPYAIQVEVRIMLEDGQRLVKADRPAEQKNGNPIFRVTVPANSPLQIRYQTASR